MNVCVVFVLFVCVILAPVRGDAPELTHENFDSVIASHQLVIVNFFADWCGFCRQLKPIYNQAADNVAKKNDPNGTVLLAKVDCEAQEKLRTRFGINKFPTIKYFLYGKLMKREYRGGRSEQGFSDFVDEHLNEPFAVHDTLDKLHEKDGHERRFVGYFNSTESTELHAYRVSAAVLRHDCKFDVIIHTDVEESAVEFRPSKAMAFEKLHKYNDTLNHTDNKLYDWCSLKSVPLVREITFENAEELTEEGKPFMLLFYHPDDEKTKETFHMNIAAELESERENLNFLTANGDRFQHPLEHMGKTKADLPLIAIDSFRHMYVFPKYDEASIPGKLKKFIQDLYSGKLHREYHFGPDDIDISESDSTVETATTTTTTATEASVQIEKSETGETVVTNMEIKTDGSSQEQKPKLPESAFKKLAPSKNRYTMRQEL